MIHPFHWWKTKYGFDDVAVYQECRLCEKRRYVQYPTDMLIDRVNVKWLAKEEQKCDKEQEAIKLFELIAPKPIHDPFLIEHW